MTNKPPLIAFKDNDEVLEKEWKELWVRNMDLFSIIEEIAVFNRIVLMRDTLIITSIYRPMDKTSVHAYWRGVDIRTHDMDQDDIELLLSYFNSRYQYDPLRPEKWVVMFHDVGLGPHIHVQNSVNTVIRTHHGFAPN